MHSEPILDGESTSPINRPFVFGTPQSQSFRSQLVFSTHFSIMGCRQHSLPLLFAVYVLDTSGAGAFECRQLHLSTHKKNAAALVKGGILTYGGPLLSPESIVSPTAEMKMVGSSKLDGSP
ncbi:hypothetical protein BKA93DRAFT_827232 [Sparassis latifolia]